MKNLFFLSFFLFLISCGGGDDDLGPQNQNPTPTPVIGIGSNGGSITSADGNVKVVIPSGALKDYVDIKVEKNTSASIESDKTASIGDVYKLTPAGTKFDKPVTIEINYSDPNEGINTDEYSIGHWTNESDTEFLEILEINNDKLKFELSSFSNVQVQKTMEDFTFIPDRNFEQALIDLGYDDKKDHFVLKSAIKNVKELDLGFNHWEDPYYLEPIYINIKSFKGLQDFVNLERLDIPFHGRFNGGIRSFDISKMTNLVELECHNNQLPSLNLENNKKLAKLSASNNFFGTIDLSENIELISLDLRANPIDQIDLIHNSLITFIDLGDTGLKLIDLTGQIDLSFLDLGNNPGISFKLNAQTRLNVFACGYNELESLDLSSVQFSNLRSLWCRGNNLTEIDLSHTPNLNTLNILGNPMQFLDFSHTPFLEVLYCGSTDLKELDISSLSNLTYLNCLNNPLLTLLNLKNGRNKDFTTIEFGSGYGEQILKCIQVDDVEWANQNWSKKLGTNTGHYFSEDCGY